MIPNNPTKILSGEHKNIMKVIDALAKECSAIESGKKIDTAFFEKAIGFIRNYADKFHHAKEENILFKELSLLHCNPVQQMLYEHDLGRGFVKGMEQALHGNKAKLIENTMGYCQLLREHIFKEDNILYPMADESLAQKTKKSILERFARADAKAKNARKYIEIAEEFDSRK